MTLIDSSAWIEFLRDTGSPTCERVDDLLSGQILICDPIRMELLAGARDESQLRSLRGLLARATTLPTEPRHYEDAAALYRTSRTAGLTVRKMIDCLIGAVAIDGGTSVLHADRDFNALAACTPLEIARGSLG